MTIRPQTFTDFHGQRHAVDLLKVAVRASKRRSIPLGHVLLVGPRGLGKTTLGHCVIPTEMEAKTRYINCAAIEKPQDLLPTLSTVVAGEILFLDEIHRLPRPLMEHLYSVMEDFRLNIVMGEGPDKKVLECTLDPFTVIGATTREGLLPDPLRDRFKHTANLDLYTDAEMAAVLRWTATKRDAIIDQIDLLVPVCHGTARHAVNLIDACLDTVWSGDAAPHGLVNITPDHIVATMKRLGYSKLGLSRGEQALLARLQNAPGWTMGLKTLAAVLNEEDETVEQVYEPWLLRCGYIVKTTTGRRLTNEGEAALTAGDW